MPFKSEKQRRYMWANHPSVAREWTDKYGSKPTKSKSGKSGSPAPHGGTRYAPSKKKGKR